VFDPLDHPGIPVDHHGRHWHEFDVEPVDTRAIDPFTLRRISMVAAVEANAERFDRQFASRVQDADARRSVGRLGDATAERRQHIAAVRAPASSAAEDAIDRERAAFNMAGWAARNEREPDRSSTYRQQAWHHLERLRRYAEFGDRAHLPWANQIADEVEGLWPPRATARARSWTPSAPVTQPLSLLHDWMVHVGDRWAAGYRPEPGEGGWEALVVHESASCYLYYTFMAEEDDRRLRPMWELHLQMQLAHLRAASDLLRRYCGRDPQEVIGEGLPEPVSQRTDRPLVWVHEPEGPERGRRARRRRHRNRDRRRPDRGQDVLELLTAHHARMSRLFGRAAGSSGDEARMAFGDLARLIVVHEIAEERMIHPLVRRLDPDDHLANRLLDEESRISEALSDAVRAAAHGHLDDTIGGLCEMVTAHSRGEEHDEFPQLRRSVPVQERGEMGRAVRAAEAAAARRQVRGTRRGPSRGPWRRRRTASATRSAASPEAPARFYPAAGEPESSGPGRESRQALARPRRERVGTADEREVLEDRHGQHSNHPDR
jgi:hemerythrin superfamily protein